MNVFINKSTKIIYFACAFPNSNFPHKRFLHNPYSLPLQHSKPTKTPRVFQVETTWKRVMISSPEVQFLYQ